MSKTRKSWDQKPMELSIVVIIKGDIGYLKAFI